MDQPKAALETLRLAREMGQREAEARHEQRKRNLSRRHLPKDVRRFLADMDAECGPDGEIYGFRD